jgi:REP element-mobilizing transposase RayT
MPLVHHAVARSADGHPLFLDDADRLGYLERLGTIADRYSWRVLAYCLMTTHTHLLIEATRVDLRVGTRRLRRAHGTALALRHGLPGPVWAPAARPLRIETERRPWAVAAYIAANPVDAGLCATAADWRWSSHPAMLGHAIAPPWLDLARLLELLGGTTRARFARYVADRGRSVKAVPAPWERARR